jgi:hypothetical protein
MRLTDEQRYRIERAKDRTPSTNAFAWLVLVFLAACWECKNTDAGQEAVQQVEAVRIDAPEVHYVKQQYSDTNYYKRDGINDQSGVNVLKMLGLI